MNPTIAALLKAATTPTTAFIPYFLGYVKSYDWQEGKEDMRRIRVNYPDGDRFITSPLLLRVVAHELDDPPMPSIQSLILGLWLREDKSQGLWLGTIVNQKQRPSNAVQAKDLVIEGKAGVEVKSPKSRLQMDKLGNVELRGQNIYFQSGAKRISIEQIFDELGFTVPPLGADYDLDD